MALIPAPASCRTPRAETGLEPLGARGAHLGTERRGLSLGPAIDRGVRRGAGHPPGSFLGLPGRCQVAFSLSCSLPKGPQTVLGSGSSAVEAEPQLHGGRGYGTCNAAPGGGPVSPPPPGLGTCWKQEGTPVPAVLGSPGAPGCMVWRALRTPGRTGVSCRHGLRVTSRSWFGRCDTFAGTDALVTEAVFENMQRSC